jgi:hypothetical protein
MATTNQSIPNPHSLLQGRTIEPRQGEPHGQCLFQGRHKSNGLQSVLARDCRFPTAALVKGLQYEQQQRKEKEKKKKKKKTNTSISIVSPANTRW